MSNTNTDDLDDLLGTSEPATTTEIPADSVPATDTPEIPAENGKVVEVVSADDDEPTEEVEDKDEDGMTSVRFSLKVKFPEGFDDKFRKALRKDASDRNATLKATLPEGTDLTKEQKTSSKDILNGLVADSFILGEKAVLAYIDAAQEREFAVRSSVITETKAKLQSAMDAMDRMKAQFKKMGMSEEEIDELMAGD